VTRTLDINADVGEGCADDEALFEIVSSANIACGGHAGDDATMRATLRAVKARGVAAGAHPSFVDREHFGRRDLQVDPERLYGELRAQIERLAALAKAEGVVLHHVKAHGALYNLAARDRAVADVVSAVTRDSGIATLYALSGSVALESAGARGLHAVAEGFADRRYRDDGSLVPRSEAGATIEDVDEAVAQVRRLVESGRAQTICVHGDNPHAVGFARGVRRALEAAGVRVARVS
jgi:UPF0271 protein